MGDVAAKDDLTVRAFTSEKVRKLTGLSARQLQYWDEQRFLSPSLSGALEPLSEEQRLLGRRSIEQSGGRGHR